MLDTIVSELSSSFKWAWLGAHGLPALVAVLMGVITATFGGVLRDIVCNEIPSLFADHKPYAVCAFLGGWTLVGLRCIEMPEEFALLVAASVAFGLRLWALLADVRLPAWVAGRDADRLP